MISLNNIQGRYIAGFLQLLIVLIYVCSIMYVAPSLTTNNAYQPAYRIYEVDGNHKHTSRVRHGASHKSDST